MDLDGSSHGLLQDAEKHKLRTEVLKVMLARYLQSRQSHDSDKDYESPDDDIDDNFHDDDDDNVQDYDYDNSDDENVDNLDEDDDAEDLDLTDDEREMLKAKESLPHPHRFGNFDLTEGEQSMLAAKKISSIVRGDKAIAQEKAKCPSASTPAPPWHKPEINSFLEHMTLPVLKKNATLRTLADGALFKPTEKSTEERNKLTKHPVDTGEVHTTRTDKMRKGAEEGETPDLPRTRKITSPSRSTPESVNIIYKHKDRTLAERVPDSNNQNSEMFRTTEGFLESLRRLHRPTIADLESTARPSLNANSILKKYTPNSASETHFDLGPSAPNRSQWLEWNFVRFQEQLFHIHAMQLQNVGIRSWALEIERAIDTVVNEMDNELSEIDHGLTVDRKGMCNALKQYLNGLNDAKKNQWDKEQLLKRLVSKALKTKTIVPVKPKKFNFVPVKMPSKVIPMSKRRVARDRGPIESNGYYAMVPRITNFMLVQGERNFTPLVRLEEIPKKYKLKCQVFVKCQYLRAMTGESFHFVAELLGHTENVDTLNSKLSIMKAGNAQQAKELAFLSKRNKLHPPIILLKSSAQSMSSDDMELLSGMGAKLILCQDNDVFINQVDDWQQVATKLEKARRDVFRIDMRKSIRNIFRHCVKSFKELVTQLHGRCDVLICDAETAILLHNLVRDLKGYAGADCKLVAVETGKCTVYGHLDYINAWYTMVEDESFQVALDLINEENLLCSHVGGSLVASAVAAATDFQLRSEELARIVVFFPGALTTGPQNYHNYHCQPVIDDSVLFTTTDMECFHYWWWNIPVMSIKPPDAVVVTPLTSVKEAFQRMDAVGTGYVVLACEQRDGVDGIITRSALTKYVKEKYNKDFGKPNDGLTPGNMEFMELEKISMGSTDRFDSNITVAFNKISMGNCAALLEHYATIILVEGTGSKYFRPMRLTNTEVAYVVTVITEEHILSHKWKLMRTHMKDLGLFYDDVGLAKVRTRTVNIKANKLDLLK